MNSPGSPEATYLFDTYRFAWPGIGVTAALENLHEERSGVAGVLSLASTSPPNPGILLPRTRINDILAPVWRRDAQRALSELDNAIDWVSVIAQVITLSDARWRQGEPVIDLRGVMPDRTRRWLIPNLLELGQNNVIFADGGTGKSVLALALAITVASGIPVLGKVPTETGAVLYLDWESDESTHATRLFALLEGHGIRLGDVYHEILYRPQYGRLHDSAAALRQVVAEHDVKLVIVDSMGAATAGEEGREAVVKTFNALRSLRTTNGIIDHVTKAEGQDPKRPYGSVYTHDLARLTFRIDKAQEVDSQSSVIALVNCKANNGRFLPKQAFRATFTTDEDDVLVSAHYEPWEVLDSPALAAHNVNDGILAILRAQGALPVAEIQQAFEAHLPDRRPPTQGSIRTKLFALRRAGRVTSAGKGDSTTWGIFTGRDDEPAIPSLAPIPFERLDPLSQSLFE